MERRYRKAIKSAKKPATALRMALKVFSFSVLGIFAASLVFSQFDTAEYQSPARWQTLVREKKIEIITSLISELAKSNVVVRKNPAFYVDEIDSYPKANPALSQKPIGIQMNIAAIMNCDYDNGQDPLFLIKEIFGEGYFNAYMRDNLQEKYIEKYDTWLVENDKIKSTTR